nr:MAG TPA: hypothetical protein [Caudoviricetes sp.]
MREVESLTSCMPCKRSSQLSYTPIVVPVYPELPFLVNRGKALFLIF